MSKSTTPFFTVIIPLYNKRDFIVQAVESVLAQECAEFELLVVDDGSTDGSAELLEAQVSDPRLRIIRQDNMGGAGGQARNTGMSEAQGEWFAFLDADDYWLPNHLIELARIIDHVGRPALISPKPIELPVGTPMQPDLRADRKIHELNYFQEAGLQIGQNNSSSSAIHREVFEKVKGFAFHHSGEDLEYWARVALEYPYAASDRITSVYYRGTTGVMELKASESKLQPPRKISKLEEVSPSLEMLVNRSKKDGALFERSDIRAYVNGRLYSGMKISLRRADPAKARQFLRLMIGPLHKKILAMTVVSLLPAFAVRILNKSYDVIAIKKK